jgi:hypothetical protein
MSTDTPDAEEVAPKDAEGIVPAEPDPEPATESGVHGSAGDEAANVPDPAVPDPAAAQPTAADEKKADEAMNPMQAVHDYGETKRA